ncbi:MAG: hypothetical protein U0T84_07655 [Chitinophagales bacterium]
MKHIYLIVIALAAFTMNSSAQFWKWGGGAKQQATSSGLAKPKVSPLHDKYAGRIVFYAGEVLGDAINDEANLRTTFTFPERISIRAFFEKPLEQYIPDCNGCSAWYAFRFTIDDTIQIKTRMYTGYANENGQMEFKSTITMPNSSGKLVYSPMDHALRMLKVGAHKVKVQLYPIAKDSKEGQYAGLEMATGAFTYVIPPSTKVEAGWHDVAEGSYQDATITPLVKELLKGRFKKDKINTQVVDIKIIDDKWTITKNIYDVPVNKWLRIAVLCKWTNTYYAYQTYYLTQDFNGNNYEAPYLYLAIDEFGKGPSWTDVSYP